MTLAKLSRWLTQYNPKKPPKFQFGDGPNTLFLSELPCENLVAFLTLRGIPNGSRLH